MSTGTSEGETSLKRPGQFLAEQPGQQGLTGSLILVAPRCMKHQLVELLIVSEPLNQAQELKRVHGQCLQGLQREKHC